MSDQIEVTLFEAGLQQILYAVFGVRFTVRLQRNGQLHCWATGKDLERAAEAWETRGRGRPQGDLAEAAAAIRLDVSGEMSHNTDATHRNMGAE